MDDKEKGKGFKVVDRRFWTQEGSDEAPDDEAGAAADKPSYLAELESVLEERNARLRELAERQEQIERDFEAARDRLKREAERDVERNRRALLAELLEIVDNLDRALGAAEKGGDSSSLAEGVAMVRDLLYSKLESHGVRRVDAIGRPFDPAVHEALAVIPAEAPDRDGLVERVIREGYLIGDDVLRPAGVAVARATS